MRERKLREDGAVRMSSSISAYEKTISAASAPSMAGAIK
jgi:hypothetical protein